MPPFVDIGVNQGSAYAGAGACDPNMLWAKHEAKVSAKNGNYKTRGRKDLCDKKIDSLLKHYFCDVHTWDEVSGSRKRVRFFGLPRKKNISSPSSTYHKFTFERTDTHIEFHCDGKLLVCINSSDDLYESFSLDLFLVISNAVCTSKSDNEENLPMFIKDLSITVL